MFKKIKQSDIMCCSTTTAHKWLKTGLIPHTKIGSIYIFNEIEVLEALKNRKSKRPNKDKNRFGSILGKKILGSLESIILENQGDII